jgi:hypothetical protein
MDIVTSDGRLTPPFHPLTVVSWAAWAGAETSNPTTENQGRRRRRKYTFMNLSNLDASFGSRVLGQR